MSTPESTDSSEEPPPEDSGRPFHIVGLGLAGAVLAWQLKFRYGDERRITAVDRDEAMTSSKIAAGLITPITGGRLSASWRYREFWTVARKFYKAIEAETGAKFLRQVPIRREFYNQEEADRFEKKDMALRKETGLGIRKFEGGFEMQGAWLDVPAFLAATRGWLESENAFEIGDFDPLAVDPDVTTIFCQGWTQTDNPWFPDVVFRGAKGQILEVESDDFSRDHVLNRRTWILPVGRNRFRVGATYEWEFDTLEPTPEGREALVEKLDAMVGDATYQIVDQTAGVRPIIQQSRPVFLQHPERPEIAFFNGLGSKGVLNAPYAAAEIAEILG